jgi:hypothetical protein
VNGTEIVEQPTPRGREGERPGEGVGPLGACLAALAVDPARKALGLAELHAAGLGRRQRRDPRLLQSRPSKSWSARTPDVRRALAPTVHHDQMAATERRRENCMSDKRDGRESGTEEVREQARHEEARAAEDERIDEEGRESFPASDPPSHTGVTGEGRRD